jgi:outer membrane protein TolC
VKLRLLLQSFLLLLLVAPVFSLGQEIEDIDLMKDDIEKLLPPLQTILDSALANNAYVKSKELQVKIDQFKLKSERRKWMQNMGFQTDVRYGTFDNFSTNTQGGQVPNLLATRSNQFNYGVGAYIKIPLYDFVNQRSVVGAAKAEIEMAESLVQVQQDELRQVVIRQYQEVILKQRLLRIKAKFLETSRINNAMTEREFQNGTSTVGEFARIAGMNASSEADFESAKIEFTTSFMLLEELAKMKFKLTKTK